MAVSTVPRSKYEVYHWYPDANQWHCNADIDELRPPHIEPQVASDLRLILEAVKTLGRDGSNYKPDADKAFEPLLEQEGDQLESMAASDANFTLLIVGENVGVYKSVVDGAEGKGRNLNDQIMWVGEGWSDMRFAAVITVMFGTCCVRLTLPHCGASMF